MRKHSNYKFTINKLSFNKYICNKLDKKHQFKYKEHINFHSTFADISFLCFLTKKTKKKPPLAYIRQC